MALLDWEQPYQYWDGSSSSSSTKAAQGGWNVSQMTNTFAPRAKTAHFKLEAWKVLGGGDGSIAPGDAGFIIGGRYSWDTGNYTGAMAPRNAEGIQISVGINSDGTLRVMRGDPVTGTLLDNSVFAMAGSGRLYYIEFDGLLHQTAGWYKVYVDNVLRIDSSVNYPSGLDTCACSTATWTGLYAAKHYYFQHDSPYVTDLYVCDHRDGTTLTPAQLEAFNTPLGDVKVSYLGSIAGNGTYTDWPVIGAADRGEALDDPADGAALNTSDYVADNVAGHRVSVALDNLDDTNATILGVMPSFSMMKDNSGSKQVKMGHIISGAGANPYLGTAMEAPAQGSYGILREPMTKNQATNASWTPTEVNALEAVAEIQ